MPGSSVRRWTCAGRAPLSAAAGALELEFQGEIEGGSGVGERAHGDAVDSAAGDLHQGVLGDAAGRLELDGPDPLRREFAEPRAQTGHDVRVHVVEQDHVGAAAHGGLRLRGVTRLAGDRDSVPHVAADVGEHLLDGPARELDVVLLHHDLVEQADPVIRPAADADRVLVERSHSRRRLARVQDAGGRPMDHVDHAPRPRRDARHALDDVEGGPLRHEQRARVAPGGEDDVPGDHELAVGDPRLHLRGGIEELQRALEGTAAGEDAALLRDQGGPAARPFGHGGPRRQITLDQHGRARLGGHGETEILGEGPPDEIIDGGLQVGVRHGRGAVVSVRPPGPRERSSAAPPPRSQARRRGSAPDRSRGRDARERERWPSHGPLPRQRRDAALEETPGAGAATARGPEGPDRPSA